MKPSNPLKPADKSGLIFRRYRTYKGKVYDAHDYGHKAWPIPIRKKKQ